MILLSTQAVRVAVCTLSADQTPLSSSIFCDTSEVHSAALFADCSVMSCGQRIAPQDDGLAFQGSIHKRRMALPVSLVCAYKCPLQAHLRGSPPVWDGATLGLLVDEVSATVREHILLDREVTNYWLAKYFEQEIARDPERTWTALLLHWVRQVRLCGGGSPMALLKVASECMHLPALQQADIALGLLPCIRACAPCAHLSL